MMPFLFVFLDADFISECELLLACRILEKQIKLVVDEGKNIIIPSKQLKRSREIEQRGIR